jgi:hypothetical protein
MNMKTIFLAGSLVITCNAVFSQARETTVNFGKDKVNAVKVEVNAPAKDVQDALSKKLISAGVKPRKGTANSVSYNSVVVPEISSDTVDIWTRVQKNGNNSIIYLAVKNQQGNYISSEADTASVEKIKDFLYDFVRAQNYSSSDLEIGSLMDSVRVDKSSMEAYTTEKNRIENQIRELNDQLKQVDQKYTTGRTEMERRKQRLDLLMASTVGNVKSDESKKPTKDNDKPQK